MRFILQSKRGLKKTTSASKIIIDRKDAKDKASKTEEKAKARANARAATTTTTTTTDRKQLLKLHKQFVCIYISLVLETVLILLNCLLLFDNLQECTNNTLYIKS